MLTDKIRILQEDVNSALECLRPHEGETGVTRDALAHLGRRVATLEASAAGLCRHVIPVSPLGEGEPEWMG